MISVGGAAHLICTPPGEEQRPAFLRIGQPVVSSYFKENGAIVPALQGTIGLRRHILNRLSQSPWEGSVSAERPKNFLQEHPFPQSQSPKTFRSFDPYAEDFF